MFKWLKQYNIKGVGSFVYVLYLSAPAIGIVMYVINAFTFYFVAQDRIQQYAPWLTFPMFILLLVAGVLVLVAGFFMLVLANYMAFNNQQSYEHQNPIRKDIAGLKEDVGLTLHEIMAIKRSLGVDDAKETNFNHHAHVQRVSLRGKSGGCSGGCDGESTPV